MSLYQANPNIAFVGNIPYEIDLESFSLVPQPMLKTPKGTKIGINLVSKFTQMTMLSDGSRVFINFQANKAKLENGHRGYRRVIKKNRVCVFDPKATFGVGKKILELGTQMKFYFVKKRRNSFKSTLLLNTYQFKAQRVGGDNPDNLVNEEEPEFFHYIHYGTEWFKFQIENKFLMNEAFF